MFRDPDKNTRIGHFGLVFGLRLATTESVKPSFYPLRNCWRVRVPASESETGKRFAKYFETQEAAQDFIAEHRKTGSIQLAELSIEEKHVFVEHDFASARGRQASRDRWLGRTVELAPTCPWDCKPP
jgi:hypothetical protein